MGTIKKNVMNRRITYIDIKKKYHQQALAELLR